MKGLQGMVRSLIGTVADQHDNTLKIQQQLEQGKKIPYHIVPYGMIHTIPQPKNLISILKIWLQVLSNNSSSPYIRLKLLGYTKSRPRNLLSLFSSFYDKHFGR